ncbi:hypothetical protein BLNAU_17102 [Blattamonas nauphoetae]|uniref:Uncharacterized protein n=1 Tax=Blattamonas nauphoetae TaxID=2049346 RepID=A0ABQ9X7Q8_9EUKA|nr:hypothetical protein BLNAU_17102 [Blattamonas nauphoetae]
MDNGFGGMEIRILFSALEGASFHPMPVGSPLFCFPKSFGSIFVSPTSRVNTSGEKTTGPCLPLAFVPQKTGPFDNKIGGQPNLPSSFAYPTVSPSAVQSNPSKQQKNNIGGECTTQSPLQLLVQLDFDTLLRVPDFPTTGIHQIYIDPADGSFGHDYESMMDQIHWRIVYHPAIEHDETRTPSERARMPERVRSGASVFDRWPDSETAARTTFQSTFDGSDLDVRFRRRLTLRPVHLVCPGGGNMGTPA